MKGYEPLELDDRVVDCDKVTDDDLKKTIREALEKAGVQDDDNEELKFVEDLLPFEKGLRSITWKQGLVNFGRIMYSVMVLAPSIVAKLLIDTSGLIYLNMLGDVKGQALYGVYDTYYVVFYFCLTTSLMDKFCIDMSTSFGDKDYSRFKTVFSKAGVVCFLYFIFFTLPMMYFSGPILKFLAVEEDKAERVQTLTMLTIPMLAINLVGEYIKCLCLSQGHEQIFGYSSIVTTGLTIFANYYAMYKERMGIEGLILCKTVNEIVTLLITIFVYFRTLPETRGFVNLAKIKENFGKFFWDAMIYMVSIYPEYLGFELTTYFIVMRNDDNQTAAFFSMMNLCCIVFCVGFAFSAICRTRINILIGMKKPEAAKNYFKFFCLVAFLVGVFVGIVVYFSRSFLASVFANSNEEVMYWYYRFTFIYFIAAGHELVMNTILVGLKTVGKVGLLLGLNILISMVGNLTIGYILYHNGFNCDMQYANYMWLSTLLTLTCFVITLRSNWRLIDLQSN